MSHHQVIVTRSSGKKQFFYWINCLGPSNEFLQKLSRQPSIIAVVYLISGIEVESYHCERHSNGELVA